MIEVRQGPTPHVCFREVSALTRCRELTVYIFTAFTQENEGMRVRQGKQFPVTGHRDSGIKLWKTAVSDRR